MRISFHRTSLISIASTALVGCASTQINYNTLDIASTYDQLITKQVTYNIRKSIESRYGLPAFVKVTAATATTQASVTPTASIPLSTGITNTIQTGATGLLSGGSRATARAAPGLGVSATDQWVQTYTLTPVVDTDQLRRLRALYQYVTRQLTSDAEFESDYPLIETGSSSAGGGAGGTKTTVSASVDGKPVTVTVDTTPQKSNESKTIYVRRQFITDLNGNFKGYGWKEATPDLTFVKPPGCILCDYGNGLSQDDYDSIDYTNEKLYKKLFDEKKKRLTVHKLEKNVALRNDWLCLSGDDVPADAIALPSNGDGTIYVKGRVGDDPQFGLKYFYEFALFTEDASSQGTGSPTSGGQSDGRKTSNVERISVPVAAGTLPAP
ncbi:hypothetical protein [Bradyrhizobium sp. S69]|uniref:hypothetical protein n=1 Tax=Bradyrhizobium sp. S69 TaxID=1641856 RepID=UPI00131D570A|nr:hypothetical protein [Bradyrhizobium sp. S69]